MKRSPLLGSLERLGCDQPTVHGRGAQSPQSLGEVGAPTSGKRSRAGGQEVQEGLPRMTTFPSVAPAAMKAPNPRSTRCR